MRIKIEFVGRIVGKSLSAYSHKKCRIRAEKISTDNSVIIPTTETFFGLGVKKFNRNPWIEGIVSCNPL